jgi:hypothetical protein
MQWFYLIALTIAFAMAAKSLWNVEQVLSIAALLTSLITFLLALITASAWGQLVMTALLLALYRHLRFSLPRYSPYQVPNPMLASVSPSSQN